MLIFKFKFGYMLKLFVDSENKYVFLFYLSGSNIKRAVFFVYINVPLKCL